MRTFGVVKASIWTDPDFVAIGIRPQRLYIVLISQPTVTACGVLPLQPRRWASFADDDTLTGVTRSLNKLAGARFVVIDEETEELLVRSFIRHDDLGKKSRDFAAREAARAVVSRPIFQTLLDDYPGLFRDFSLQSARNAFSPNGSRPGDQTLTGEGPRSRTEDPAPTSPGDVDRTGEVADRPEALSSLSHLDERAVRYVRDVAFQLSDRELEDELRVSFGIHGQSQGPYFEIAAIRRASAALFGERAG